MGFIYAAAPPPGRARRGTADSRTNEGSVTLPLKGITAHGAAGGAAIPFGVTVETCQVNGRPAGHLTLIRRLGVVSTDRHPLKGTGGEVGGGDVTHEMGGRLVPQYPTTSEGDGVGGRGTDGSIMGGAVSDVLSGHVFYDRVQDGQQLGAIGGTVQKGGCQVAGHGVGCVFFGIVADGGRTLRVPRSFRSSHQHRSRGHPSARRRQW